MNTWMALSIGYGPHTVGRYSSEGVIRCGGRRRSPVASRQHHLATSVALRAPSVSAKSLSVES